MVSLSRNLGCGLLLCLVAVPAWADEPGDDVLDGVGMEVVGDPDADESEYVDEIFPPSKLPADVAAEENAGFGIDKANEARDEASEAQQDFGDSTRGEAQDLPGDSGTNAP